MKTSANKLALDVVNATDEKPLYKLVRTGDRAKIIGYAFLEERLKTIIQEIVAESSPCLDGDSMEFACTRHNLKDVGRALSGLNDRPPEKHDAVGKPIDFDRVVKTAAYFCEHLQKFKEELWQLLRPYETWEVLSDEISRVEEYLKNLEKNKEWFTTVAPGVAAFLPLNQPLYALVCFAIVPSLMSDCVYVRAPTAMAPIFADLIRCLGIKDLFPNIIVFDGDRDAYVAKIRHEVKTVIFIGAPKNCEAVRHMFPPDVLFLANSAGHNPILVMEDADVSAAIESVLRVIIYNQGQDCAAPNAILVHEKIICRFQDALLSEVKKIEDKVGISQTKDILIKANTDIQQAVKVAKFYVRNFQYGVYGGQINPLTSLIYPSIFVKPLKDGANFDELFAPIFFLQPFNNQAQLESYLFSHEYREKAMYLTLFGTAPDLEASLIREGIHSSDNILHDTNLHAFEKGYLPYGGHGRLASCIYHKGAEIPSAILPPREIFRYTVVSDKLPISVGE